MAESISIDLITYSSIFFFFSIKKHILNIKMDGGIKLSKRLEVEREGLRKEFNERDTLRKI